MTFLNRVKPIVNSPFTYFSYPQYIFSARYSPEIVPKNIEKSMSFIAPDYSSSIESFQSSSEILSSAKLPEQPLFEKMQDATMNERNIGNTNEELLTLLSKKKEAKWPEWDGKSESLRPYLFELRVKIEEDRHLLGSNRAVCLGMLGTLPKNKKSMVDNWFESGGSDGGYDWLQFLAHFKELFEDKRSLLTAGKELSRMKQGFREVFGEFIQRYELKLSQCGGNKWDSLMKIVHLNNGLNDELEKALIGIDMPPLDNYIQWRDKVREVAERLESHKYRTQTTQTQISPMTSSTSILNSSTKDAEGDTPMTGVNALFNLLNSGSQSNLNAIIAGLGKLQGNKSGQDNRPRATWRSQNEFLKLVNQGVCARCAKSGHLTKQCPTYRPAARPNVDINAASGLELSKVEPGKESP